MQDNSEFDEVDVLEQLRRLWLCRRLILFVMLLCLIVGCVVALILPKEYEASCDVVPQPTSSATLSRMSSLAALAGINIRESTEDNVLSPYVYENIFYSVKFGKELLQTTLPYVNDSESVMLIDYILRKDEVYQETPRPITDAPLEFVTKADYAALKELWERVTITLNDKKGVLTISALMSEPVVAAQVVTLAVEQLQRYVTTLKVEKVQSNLDFISTQYDEARRHFESVQSRRARFRDSNRNTTRYAALSELENLDAEYSLAMNVYNELAMQLEQAKIKVRETMPILTIINPVSVPFYKKKPKRMIIIIIFVMVGCLIGSVLSLTIPTISEVTGYSSLLRLLPKEARCYDTNEGSITHLE